MKPSTLPFGRRILCYDGNIKREEQCNAPITTRNTKTAITPIVIPKVERNLLRCVMQSVVVNL